MSGNKLIFFGIDHAKASFDRVQDHLGNELIIDDNKPEIQVACKNKESRSLGFWETLKFRMTADESMYEAYRHLLKKENMPDDRSTSVSFDLGDFPSPLKQFCDKSKDNTPQK